MRSSGIPLIDRTTNLPASFCHSFSLQHYLQSSFQRSETNQRHYVRITKHTKPRLRILRAQQPVNLRANNIMMQQQITESAQIINSTLSALNLLLSVNFDKATGFLWAILSFLPKIIGEICVICG